MTIYDKDRLEIMRWTLTKREVVGIGSSFYLGEFLADCIDEIEELLIYRSLNGEPTPLQLLAIQVLQSECGLDVGAPQSISENCNTNNMDGS